MSQAQALVKRIHDLAKKLNKEPSTLSRELLGSGVRLAEIENGSTMTLDTYARVEAAVAELERRAA
jgi:IS30 family transposase